MAFEDKKIELLNAIFELLKKVDNEQHAQLYSEIVIAVERTKNYDELIKTLASYRWFNLDQARKIAKAKRIIN